VRIGGLKKVSLIDYPGKISCIVFTQGCNYRCGYCHNVGLVDPKQYSDLIPEAEIFSFLERRKCKLDAVVVSGGEPTLQPDLLEFIKRVKALGFEVKLDTNGSRPQVLEALLGQGMLDYVALDLKSPLDERYHRAAGVKVPLDALLSSIELLLTGQVEYEFRTTLVPSLVGKEELKAMAQSVKGARYYVLQQFVPEHALTPELRSLRPYTRAEVEDVKSVLVHWVEKVGIRGRFS
jgi:pyruvate formate lyase activating enzyme